MRAVLFKLLLLHGALEPIPVTSRTGEECIKESLSATLVPAIGFLRQFPGILYDAPHAVKLARRVINPSLTARLDR